MAGEKVLIIDDDKNIVRFLELELCHEGYSVAKEYDGAKGLRHALKEKFDLILLDIMLPSLGGMDVLRQFRASSDTPVIMLTAKDSVNDKVVGLDSGADDYITKPFAIEELLARMHALLKGAVPLPKAMAQMPSDAAALHSTAAPIKSCTAECLSSLQSVNSTSCRTS